MNKQVNFEDSLFLLMMRIRIIRDTITLDADPELFLEKTLDEIYFTDSALNTLLGYLRENDRLIERDELLEHILELDRQFSQALKDLLEHDGNFSIRQIPSFEEKILSIRNNSLERREIIENLPLAEDTSNEEAIVSSDELTELLKAF